MVRKILGAVAIVVLVAGSASALTNFFWSGHQDFPLPDSACYVGTATVGAVPFVLNGELWTLYTCSDNRQWARRWSIAAPASAVPVVAAPAPAPDPSTIACPGSHPACAFLPAGTYEKAWADSVVGG